METAILVLLLAPAAALLVSFFGLYPRAPRLVHIPILLSCLACAGAAIYLAARAAGGASLDVSFYRWMFAGDFLVQYGARADGLSCAVLAMVCVVGTLIHFYAVEYMEHDESFARFFLCFHFFFLSMLGLLLSNNYIEMYMYWEGVGAASFLLISFWYGKASARAAGLKAFIVNRAGDFGFLLAALLILASFGSADFSTVFASLGSVGAHRLTLIAFLLLWAASAKSAQFPLHIWLPDAMEGPTPVSALMHAATMVTAGVFLLARSMPLLEAAPAVLPWIIGIGTLTALGAAVVASVKTDLKRILAYSTVSHLGLMVMAIGLGSAAAGVFHLIVHGFFKALLFLCAGNVLHAMGKPSAGVDEAGGLWKKLPVTFGCFLAASLSLAGIPPFAGFYSKDRILDLAFGFGNPVLSAAGYAIAILSAFYIFRMLFLTFFGPSRQQVPPEHPHEGGAWMTIPCVLLAVGSLVVGWFSSAYLRVLGTQWGGLEPLLLGPSAIGTACALAGACAAYLWTRTEYEWKARREHAGVVGWVDGEFGWQAFMRRVFVDGYIAFSEAVARGWDKNTLDRAIESLSDGVRVLAGAGSRLASGLLNEYLWWMLAGTVILALVAR